MSDLILPGFQTPASPKLDERIFASVDGTVETTIAQVPIGTPMPDYKVYLSIEYGRMVRAQLIIGTGQIIRKAQGAASDVFILRIGPPTVTIYPGSYTLRVLVGNQETLKKSLTVLNHPALPNPPALVVAENLIPPLDPAGDWAIME